MPTSSRTTSRVLLAGVSVAVVVVDQVTKSVVESRLAHHPVHVVGPVSFRLEYNTGAAFSIGRGWAPALGILAVIAVGAIWYSLANSGSTASAVAGGLVAGGALGNLSDRLFRSNHGAVIDFVYTSFWPTFNVADSCITVGIAVLLVLTLRGTGHRPQSEDTS